MFGNFPVVPSSVHSLQSQRPAYPLDPTSSSLAQNPFPTPGQNAGHSGGSINREDVVVPPPGRRSMLTDAIVPMIPPKPGTFIRTPASQFFNPNRIQSGPQTGMYNRVPQKKINVPWTSQFFSQPPRISGTQMIGPVVGPRNPPHLMNPSQPHKKIAFPHQFPPSTPYSPGHQQQIIPQSSHLMPSVADPPNLTTNLMKQMSAESQANHLDANAFKLNPSKMYAVPHHMNVHTIPSDVPVTPVTTMASTSPPNHEKASVSPATSDVSTKSIIEVVMNAVTGWDSNEVRPTLSYNVIMPLN